MEAAAAADRVVVLGDALELREAAHRDVLALAGDVFAELGAALGPGKELVLVAGNHDHGLVAGWIDARLQSERPGFLGLEQRIDPAQAGPLARALVERAQPAHTTLAYPGVWLREDVYALHGHYCDLHSTVPTFERLAAGAMARWVVHLPEHGATPDDYEAALAPLYAWLHQVTQRMDESLIYAGSGASARAWASLAGRAGRSVRTAAARAAFAGAVAGLNRAGLGPVRADLSGAGLRRGALRGIGEALRRLGVDAPYVIWGHSHRAGPWPADDPGEWTAPTGSRILNAGCWVYQPHFLSERPYASPYWPGTAVVVEDDGRPPELIRLLGDRGHRELAAPA
jgi:hypothetical protein